MTAVALLAVMADRNPFSLRLLAWSALVVLVLRPESVLGASFQLSFAAVLALMVVYEGWSRRAGRRCGRARAAWAGLALSAGRVGHDPGRQRRHRRRWPRSTSRPSRPMACWPTSSPCR